METISTVTTTNCTITGTIQGSQVNISYSQTGTDKPAQINASCTIVSEGGASTAPVNNMGPGMMPNGDNTNISMIMYPNGQKQVNVNGKLTITDVTAILTELETELLAIFSQFK